MLRLFIIAAIILVVVYLVTPSRVFTPGKQKSKRFLETFVAQNGGRNDDPEVKRLIHRIVGRFSPVVHNQLDDIDFTVVMSKIPNACAIGIHDICITQGLIDLLDRRDTYLAPIIAHELGHIVCGHAATRWKDGVFMNIATFMLTLVFRSGWLSGLFASAALSKFSRVQEFEADAFSVRLVKSVGYNPEHAAIALEKVTAFYKGHIGNDVITRYFASHPPLDQRLEQMKQIANE